MRPKQTLGERKSGNCRVCGAEIAMWRHDRKYCSEECGRKSRNEAHWIGMSQSEVDEKNRRRRERRLATNERRARQKEANPSGWQQKQHARYLKYREKIAAKTKTARAEHPEWRKNEYRNERQKRPWLRPLVNARHRVLKGRGGRSLEFTLTREWCESNWTGRCAVTGLPFSLDGGRHYPFAPSIDRIDNSRGYTKDNCRFIIFAANALKGIGTDEQMLVVAKALVEYAAKDHNSPCP